MKGLSIKYCIKRAACHCCCWDVLVKFITTVRHRKTSIFHMLTFEKTQPKLLDKLDQTYSNLIDWQGANHTAPFSILQTNQGGYKNP